MDHTLEPWRIGGRDGRAWTITDERSTHAAFPVIFGKYGNRIANIDSHEAESGDANARRIVACVNACAGITTEELENRQIKEGTMQEFVYQNEGLLDVKVISATNAIIETGLILDSLRAALEQATYQADEGYESGNPILSASE